MTAGKCERCGKNVGSEEYMCLPCALKAADEEAMKPRPIIEHKNREKWEAIGRAKGKEEGRTEERTKMSEMLKEYSNEHLVFYEDAFSKGKQAGRAEVLDALGKELQTYHGDRQVETLKGCLSLWIEEQRKGEKL